MREIRRRHYDPYRRVTREEFAFFTEDLFIIAAGPQHANLLGTQVLAVQRQLCR